MPYRPGDNYCICDLSGHKIWMSESVKTWDGLRVDPRYWYERHPQLDVKAVPERSMAVIDGRPEAPDQFVGFAYGYGSLTLISPNGTFYVVYVASDGALLVRPGLIGVVSTYVDIPGGRLTVDDDGGLQVQIMPNPTSQAWRLASADDDTFKIIVDSDGALLVTATTGLYD